MNAKTPEITDSEREMLIRWHVERAKDYVESKDLARYHIDRARSLISARSQERPPDHTEPHCGRSPSLGGAGGP